MCAGLPALLAMLLAAYWLSVPLIGIGGDEPHYQILAASVVRDADLDLRNNYAEDERTREIFGRIEPHVYPTDAGWMPYHTPGLGFVLGVPFELGGQLGSRLALSLGPLLLALVSWRWFRSRLSAPATAWLTMAVAVSLPAVFGATQIYPDLLGGFVMVGLAAWVWSDGVRRSSLGWTSFWLVTGLVVWLHLKFAAPAVILAAIGGWVAWREVAAGVASSHRQLACAAAFLPGPVAMAWFHHHGFGTIWGGRTAVELSTDVLRGLSLFLGLHFDQGQGMLFQHPLLFVGGLGALGVMLRRQPLVAFAWGGLYLSLVVPNAMQLARYGGGGPAGRFGWSALWLWLVPIGVAVAVHRDWATRMARPFAAGSLLYQALLAGRWIPEPRVLFPVLAEALDERNSLFPVAWRGLLPSFYFWDYWTYLVYPPNLVWMGMAAGLIVAGFRVGRVTAASSLSASTPSERSWPRSDDPPPASGDRTS